MKTKILLLAIAALFLSGTIRAQIIHVPANQPTIQAGIIAASAGDTVLVDTGTYYENIRFMGKAITVASNYIMDGDSSHIENTVIDGSQAADPDSAATVMFVNGEDTTSIINGFTITGGSGVFYMTYQARAGGGIYTYNAGCKIINNTITGNAVDDDNIAGGAGIACIMETGDYWTVVRDNTINYNSATANGFSAFGGGLAPTTNCFIENNLIENNTCTNTGGATDGGGIELEALPGANPVAFVTGNTIRYNELSSTTYSLGAGIICNGFTTVEIKDNVISNNSISAQTNGFGSGIFAYAITDGIEIVDNIIERNICEGENLYGIGICIRNSGKTFLNNNVISENEGIATNVTGGGGAWIGNATDTVNIINNEFTDNTTSGNAFGGGVGIYSITYDVVYFDKNVLSNNYSSLNGGGLWTFNTYRIEITNNLFQGNEAKNNGGALGFRQYLGKNENGLLSPGDFEHEFDNSERNRDETYHPLIANNTFIFNTASRGGSIDTDNELETPVIINSIFWNNSATTGIDIQNWSNSDLIVYNNNIDTNLINTPWSGADNILCDPDLQSDSLHLDYPSLCLNAGIASLEYDGVMYYSPETDIDGEARPYEGTIPDIGADEAQWLYVTVDESTAVNKSFANYPNPFTTTTTITYELAQPATVQITIYNHLGKQLEIIEQIQSAGKQQVVWNAEGLPSGVYFCVLKAKEGTKTTKMIKMK